MRVLSVQVARRDEMNVNAQHGFGGGGTNGGGTTKVKGEIGVGTQTWLTILRSMRMRMGMWRPKSCLCICSFMLSCVASHYHHPTKGVSMEVQVRINGYAHVL